MLLRKNLVDGWCERVGLLSQTTVPERAVVSGGQGRERRVAGFLLVAGKLAANGRIDRVARHVGDAWADAAVQKQDTVDFSHSIQFSEVAAVATGTSERDPHLDEPERRLLEQLIAPRLISRFDELLPNVFRFGAREGFVLTRHDIAHVAEHAHDFVVAEEQVDGATG